MNKITTSLLISITAVLSFISSGCQQNQSNIAKNNTDSVTVKAPPVIEIKNSSFSGKVKNRNGELLSGVSVSTGELTAQTGKDGFFAFNQVKTVDNRTIITFQKEGYFPTIHSGEWNGEEYIEIMLHPYGNSDISLQTTFNSTEKQTLSIGKMKIELPAEALVDADGNIYKNAVSANLLYLDPTAGHFSGMMPGSDLAAIRTDAQEAILVSYGMVKVELKDTSGNKLQLREGKPATATYPIPAGMEKTAPDTIPLWFFNEENGLWVEEGSALRQGEVYIGKLAHFTWWNVDYPYQRQEIRGRVTDCNGKPAVNVFISTVQNGFYTDSDGFYRVFVPAGVPSSFVIGSAGYVDSIPARAGGTVIEKNIKITSCLSQLTGKIENSCGRNSTCELFCEYKLKEKKYYTKVSNYKMGEQFSIGFPSNVPSVILHILLPNGEVIKKDFVCNGENIQAENIQVCIKDSKGKENTLIEYVSKIDDFTEIDPTIFDEDKVYDFADQMPLYPGGEQEMFAFIAKNMRYPAEAIDEGIQGRVVVRFMVSKTGEISDVSVIRSLHPFCDLEAVRVIKKMPQWIPGKHKGKPVNVRYNIPISFKLVDSN